MSTSIRRRSSSPGAMRGSGSLRRIFDGGSQRAVARCRALAGVRCDFSSLGDTAQTWIGDDTVRVAEYYELVITYETIGAIRTPDGSVVVLPEAQWPAGVTPIKTRTVPKERCAGRSSTRSRSSRRPSSRGRGSRFSRRLARSGCSPTARSITAALCGTRKIRSGSSTRWSPRSSSRLGSGRGRRG